MDKYSAFWERMAQKYPLPFDEENAADTRRVISIVKNRGVDFPDTTILDIGCGTGIYSLPLAREALSVTALDDSEAMLSRMQDVISSTGMKNVFPIKASWKDIDTRARGFEKAFDLAWISMSPAVQTRKDFIKMERCARKWCVYIGWGRKRENPLMEEVYRRHDLRFGPPPGVSAAYKILVKSGKQPSLDFFETSWPWEGTVDEAVADMTCYIEWQGGRPRPDLIREILAPYEQNGRISHVTHVEEGIMVWRVA